MSRTGEDRIGEGMQQDAVMACIGLWYVSATAGRVANRMPPLWRTCLGALGGC
jgi:hypothetical protein